MIESIPLTVSALADIGHLLESVELPEQRLERTLHVLSRLVPYDQCALLIATSAETPIVVDATSMKQVFTDGNAKVADVCTGAIAAACTAAGIS